jgi:hypothetical protein
MLMLSPPLNPTPTSNRFCNWHASMLQIIPDLDSRTAAPGGGKIFHRDNQEHGYPMVRGHLSQFRYLILAQDFVLASVFSV